MLLLLGLYRLDKYSVMVIWVVGSGQELTTQLNVNHVYRKPIKSLLVNGVTNVNKLIYKITLSYKR
jgi:hypothetical protein